MELYTRYTVLTIAVTAAVTSILAFYFTGSATAELKRRLREAEARARLSGKREQGKEADLSYT